MDFSVGLLNPKYPDNLATIKRTVSCFGGSSVVYSGSRLNNKIEELDRVPRGIRGKLYEEVECLPRERFISDFAEQGYTPIAIEVDPNGLAPIDLIHPEKALYVFGPEDGSILPCEKQFCHAICTIPTKQCLNIATAVSIILYSRWEFFELRRRLE